MESTALIDPVFQLAPSSHERAGYVDRSSHDPNSLNLAQIRLRWECVQSPKSRVEGLRRDFKAFLKHCWNSPGASLKGLVARQLIGKMTPLFAALLPCDPNPNEEGCPHLIFLRGGVPEKTRKLEGCFAAPFYTPLFPTSTEDLLLEVPVPVVEKEQEEAWSGRSSDLKARRRPTLQVPNQQSSDKSPESNNLLETPSSQSSSCRSSAKDPTSGVFRRLVSMPRDDTLFRPLSLKSSDASAKMDPLSIFERRGVINVVFLGKVFLFGGIKQETFYNDLWIFQLKANQQYSLTRIQRNSRSHRVPVYNGSTLATLLGVKLFIWTLQSVSYTLWSLDLTSNMSKESLPWQKVALKCPDRGRSPSGGTAMTSYGPRLFIYGIFKDEPSLMIGVVDVEAQEWCAFVRMPNAPIVPTTVNFGKLWFVFETSIWGVFNLETFEWRYARAPSNSRIRPGNTAVWLPPYLIVEQGPKLHQPKGRYEGDNVHIILLIGGQEANGTLSEEIDQIVVALPEALTLVSAQRNLSFFLVECLQATR